MMQVAAKELSADNSQQAAGQSDRAGNVFFAAMP